MHELLTAVGDDVVGREGPLESVVAVLAAGRDLLLEGPPGTSKSTILRAVARHMDVPLFFLEGNSDLTPSKLLGHHDPAQVLRHGYRPEDFVMGPLPEAMRTGGLLYLEELNRTPEDTLNVLLTAMAEREVHIPRVGRHVAAPSFRLVAAMNPFDNVGTNRVSVSINDRFCRLRVDYQPEPEERRVVALRTGCDDERLVALAVTVARATRTHPELRSGSSVRGAIDFVLVAGQLHGHAALATAARLAFSSKVVMRHPARRTPEEVLDEIVAAALSPEP